MRIAYTSDLHIEASPRNLEATRRIAELMVEARPDVVIVAGDAGNTLEDLERALGMFTYIDAQRFFVSGNHDVWVEPSEGRVITSPEKYEMLIPQLCEKMGFVDLTRSPVHIDGIGFVGSLGWYDYTFADPALGLSEDQYWHGEYEGEKWWDKEMTLWAAPGGERARDPVVCDWLSGVLNTHIHNVDEHVDRIVAVVHTLPFLETLPRSEPPYYLDAFTGSERLGQILQFNRKVTHCIGGHKHLAGDWRVGNISAHRRPLGRVEEDASIEDAAKAAVDFIEV